MPADFWASMLNVPLKDVRIWNTVFPIGQEAVTFVACSDGESGGTPFGGPFSPWGVRVGPPASD